MSRRESKVDNVIDTEFSSGDCIKTKKQVFQEENNNEIDELSKDLSEMGCIVDAVKQPNICVENCVYESESETEENPKTVEEDGYSDEFEEDKSETEDELKVIVSKSDECTDLASPPPLKLSKSQSTMSSRPVASVSGKSSGYGSVSVPVTKRINMSFSNDRLREIERHNQLLLNKILGARNVRKSSIPNHKDQNLPKVVPSAAVHRKKQQRQIDRENMILLKKIQRAKSTTSSFRR